jgi:hypothetical protein
MSGMGGTSANPERQRRGGFERPGDGTRMTRIEDGIEEDQNNSVLSDPI